MTAFDLVLFWDDAKTWIVDTLQLSRPLLHVHLGLAIYGAAALLLRRPIGSIAPLSVVVALELVNETFDTVRYFASGWPWKPDGTVADLFHTLLWPVLLTLIPRFQPTSANRFDPKPD